MTAADCSVLAIKTIGPGIATVGILAPRVEPERGLIQCALDGPGCRDVLGTVDALPTLPVRIRGESSKLPPCCALSSAASTLAPPT